MAKNFINLGISFNNLVKRYPKNIALNFGDNQKYTYLDLDRSSEKIINLFIKLKLKKKNIIAIESKKTFVSFSLIVACWKMGITYSFFDTDDNSERVKKIINTLKPSKIFTFSKRGVKNECLLNKNLLNLTNKLVTRKSSYVRDKKLIAYIMFTSGSTGLPKGVLISHYNLSYFINWTKSNFSINHKTILTNLNPLHFDNSVFDIYASLLNGGCLVPFKKEELFNLKNLIMKINETNCNIWFSVPSLLNFLLQVGNKRIFRNLKVNKMIFGGERFPLNSVKKIFSYIKKTKIYNVSGPTECTCICSAHRVTKNELLTLKNIPIGKINSYFNYQIILKGKKSNQGELFLEGPAVSEGYFKNDKVTNDKFYNIKKFNGYKTGDIVEKYKKNNLRIIGRIDNQIKFLGYRIELEEIENILIKLFNIDECLILIKNQKKFPHEKMVCYVNNNHKNKINSKNLNKISLSLPYYMCPKELIYVSNFQYNKNGKLDRNYYKKLK
jgi:D-alanine--poly(phosphoribitol) ligase subunit 1